MLNKKRERTTLFLFYYKTTMQDFTRLPAIAGSHNTYCAKTRQCMHQICIGQLLWWSLLVPFHHSCCGMWTQLSRLSLHASTLQSNSAICSGVLGLSKLSASPSICYDRGYQELQMLLGRLGTRDKKWKQLVVPLVFAVMSSPIKATTPE